MNKTDLEMLAAAMSAALLQHGRGWKAAHHEHCLAGLAAMPGMTMPDYARLAARIGNVSAVRQELEKGGVIPTSAKEPSALCKAILAELPA